MWSVSPDALPLSRIPTTLTCLSISATRWRCGQRSPPTIAPFVQSPALHRLALVNNAADVALYGRLLDVDAADMLRAYAVNSVAPVLLMGLVVRHVAESTAVRIVNVSTVCCSNGLSRAGHLWDDQGCLAARGHGDGRGTSVWSVTRRPPRHLYPFLRARSSGHTDAARGPQRFAISLLPIVDVFKGLKANEELVAPDLTARDIVSHIDADGHPPFTEGEYPLAFRYDRAP